MSTRQIIESVQELVLNQESQPVTHPSVRKIAEETDRDNHSHSHQVYVFQTQHWKLSVSVPKIRQLITPTLDIDIALLSVSMSVCPYVRYVPIGAYCMETA